MKLLQTTLTRKTDGTVLVHGTEEDKTLDCVVAHALAPTFLTVRLLAEAEDALGNPTKTLTAIREAFANPTMG